MGKKNLLCAGFYYFDENVEWKIVEMRKIVRNHKRLIDFVPMTEYNVKCSV